MPSHQRRRANDFNLQGVGQSATSDTNIRSVRRRKIQKNSGPYWPDRRQALRPVLPVHRCVPRARVPAGGRDHLLGKRGWGSEDLLVGRTLPGMDENRPSPDIPKNPPKGVNGPGQGVRNKALKEGKSADETCSKSQMMGSCDVVSVACCLLCTQLPCNNTRRV